MHLKHFLTYIQYSGNKPADIPQSRWGAMCRWYATRLGEGFTPQNMYDGFRRKGGGIYIV